MLETGKFAHSVDVGTAAAFSDSWNNCFSASPYTERQAREWFEPLRLDEDLRGLTVCELGCGNGGLLHYAARNAARAVGVDLGSSVDSAKRNLQQMGISNVSFERDDIIAYADRHAGEFDFVYCIGVLHHMKDPYEGFKAAVKATKSGGRFHCWVYGWEGNFLVRAVIDPLRKMVCRLPWFINKYAVALPLSVPFYLMSQAARSIKNEQLLSCLPLGGYLGWIGRYSFKFHFHVAFDQLVTPQTTYIKKETIEGWLNSPDICDAYIIRRNGNSWKMGGRKK